jgi:hypothetical protein
VRKWQWEWEREWERKKRLWMTLRIWISWHLNSEPLGTSWP